MSNERRHILELLAQGKINAEEAEELLSALQSPAAQSPEEPVQAEKSSPKSKARFLRIEVHRDNGRGDVNIRVPVVFLRAGMKLGSIIPGAVSIKGCADLDHQDLGLDFDRLKPEAITDLIERLSENPIRIEKKGKRVLISCE